MPSSGKRVTFFFTRKLNLLLSLWQNPIPTNKPGVEPKRPPRPVNITPNVKLSPIVANHIAVSWCTEYNRGYAAACYLVRKLTSTQLLQRMKTKGVKPADYTRALSKWSTIYEIISINFHSPSRYSQRKAERRCRLRDCHHNAEGFSDLSFGQDAHVNALQVSTTQLDP